MEESKPCKTTLTEAEELEIRERTLKRRERLCKDEKPVITKENAALGALAAFFGGLSLFFILQSDKKDNVINKISNENRALRNENRALRNENGALRNENKDKDRTLASARCKAGFSIGGSDLRKYKTKNDE